MIQQPTNTAGGATSLPAPPSAGSVTLTINGVQRHMQLAPWTTLLDALREYADLTGTKKGCDHGQCGSCTVLVNGKRINSCLTLAVMQEGNEITTIEGLGQPESLSPLQQAFIDHDAFQCGYCTPGQICSAQGLLNEGRAHTEDEIRELMSGNICRCGAYVGILAAVKEVVDKQSEIVK
ncbi:2Fe-2S iron-sulfur cluster binding domain-containing protein [Hymenobacter sp. BT186]|uniref:2Fe-2S iron-sulfur cluster binding domain-containing protein n=1 Tax=Hymenobacter telluris TaxID=2816474 RepID=A0A939JD93_9BACT|nr:2Fe-2S iron-sulfur cluster-binding protein [Hymenobacter telluris]MBO0358107.1 2Fe-2S iron-sulfur cluster binding domain-containing protein [Hymenobacter telluris]MBW3374134.1 2Fe-2S iron-sulfur cluster binding domain-containing protein [Hymenobacter norwichensis]